MSLAPHRSDRAPHQTRLCSLPPVAGGRGLSTGTVDPFGARQLEYPSALSPLRHVPARGSPTNPEGLEFHYTPKHGSWLNMAEIEISIIERGCLSRPVGDVPTLCRRVQARDPERNAAYCPIRWQFTAQDAR